MSLGILPANRLILASYNFAPLGYAGGAKCCLKVYTRMPQISLREFVLWLIGRRKRVVVKNRSMIPSLYPNDVILVQLYSADNMTLKVGDVITFHHPRYPNETLVKRIFQIHSDYRIDVRGDNADEGTDSRQFGSIAREDILGKVVCFF